MGQLKVVAIGDADAIFPRQHSLVTSEQNSSRTKANEVIRISQDHL